MKKIALLSLICLLLLSGCSNSEMVVKHHLLNRDDQVVSLKSEKCLTDFIDFYPNDSKSQSEILNDLLQEGTLANDDYESIDLNVGNLSINNITPQYNKLTFAAMMSCDAVNLQIQFEFDTGDVESIAFDAAPANSLVSGNVDLPINAKKICIQAYTYKPATILSQQTYEIDNCNEFKHLSNNTIEFNCKQGRYLMMTRYGKILDDLELAGKGTIVTANGVTHVMRVEVKDGT